MKQAAIQPLPDFKPDFSFEDRHGTPARLVCGIDEVGRGPLAGPVVAAAVIIRRDEMPAEILAQINDSKQLTPQKRAFLYGEIHKFSYVALAECSVDEIDRINILQATLRAMKKAHDKLVKMVALPPLVALVDGNKAPKLGRDVEVVTIVQGDAKSYSIAAASIVAKHHRDEIMRAAAKKFPHYGWETNAGYGTAQHLKALEIHGITRLHRRSFAPVSKQSVKERSANN